MVGVVMCQLCVKNRHACGGNLRKVNSSLLKSTHILSFLEVGYIDTSMSIFYPKLTHFDTKLRVHFVQKVFHNKITIIITSLLRPSAV